MAVLRTLPNWTADRGSLETYLWTAIQRVLQAALLRAGSPVSCRSNSDVGMLSRITRTGLEEVGAGADGSDDQLHRCRQADLVRSQLDRLVTDDPSLAPGLRVLLHDELPDDVAADLGVPPREVLRSRRRMVKILEMDPTLWLLWKEG